MGLKIMLITGLAVVLIVGFCVGGVVTGESGMQEGVPLTVMVTNGFSSLFGDSVGGNSAPSGLAEDGSGSTVHEIGAYEPDDPYYYGAEIHATARPLPAEAIEKKLVMNQNLNFAWTAKSYEANIVDGPLVICYYINEHDDTTYDCFMALTVTDCATGEVLLKDGYRRQYSADLEKECELFREGKMQIDLYGNKVNADILIFADE